MISDPLRDVSGVVSAVQSFGAAVRDAGLGKHEPTPSNKRAEKRRQARKRERQARRKGRQHG